MLLAGLRLIYEIMKTALQCTQLRGRHLEIVATRRLIRPVEHDWGLVHNLDPLDLALLRHAPAFQRRTFCKDSLQSEQSCLEDIGPCQASTHETL